VETLHSEIHNVITWSGTKKNCLSSVRIDCHTYSQKAKVAEQTEDEPLEEPQCFSTKEIVIAFCQIASAMAGFEKMGPNSLRFLNVNRRIDDTVVCYIYKEKKRPLTSHLLLSL
jgi:hypothetical protein